MRRLASALLVVLLTGGCGEGASRWESRTTATATIPARSPVPTIAESALLLPRKAGSLRLAVIGDSGRGNRPQYDVAAQMEGWRTIFPFDLVLMAGDNVYDGGSAEDYQRKFELPYKPLLDEGVTFRSALGNHDDPNQVRYEPLNMDGHRYYTFARRLGTLGTSELRVFVLDTVHLDYAQLRWLDRELTGSKADWKIALFHHPIYTSGRYRASAAQLRRRLEPIFVRGGVDAAFSGHEHFYERSRPQHGITYFVTGAGGSLRRGDISSVAGREQRAAGFDRDNHFVLVEVARDELYFQAISRTGETIDSGVLRRRETSTSDTAVDR